MRLFLRLATHPTPRPPKRTVHYSYTGRVCWQSDIWSGRELLVKVPVRRVGSWERTSDKMEGAMEGGNPTADALKVRQVLYAPIILYYHRRNNNVMMIYKMLATLSEKLPPQDSKPFPLHGMLHRPESISTGPPTNSFPQKHSLPYSVPAVSTKNRWSALVQGSIVGEGYIPMV